MWVAAHNHKIISIWFGLLFSPPCKFEELRHCDTDTVDLSFNYSDTSWNNDSKGLKNGQKLQVEPLDRHQSLTEQRLSYVMGEQGENLLLDGFNKTWKFRESATCLSGTCSPDCMNACYILSNVQPFLTHLTVLLRCVWVTSLTITKTLADSLEHSVWTWLRSYLPLHSSLTCEIAEAQNYTSIQNSGSHVLIWTCADVELGCQLQWWLNNCMSTTGHCSFFCRPGQIIVF